MCLNSFQVVSQQQGDLSLYSAPPPPPVLVIYGVEKVGFLNIGGRNVLIWRWFVTRSKKMPYKQFRWCFDIYQWIEMMH